MKSEPLFSTRIPKDERFELCNIPLQPNIKFNPGDTIFVGDIFFLVKEEMTFGIILNKV